MHVHEHGNRLEGIPFAGQGYEVWFVPREVIEAIFAKALDENKFLIPEYAHATVTVEGKPLRLSGDANPGPEQPLLGTATQEVGAQMMPDAADFELRFYLTSREQMLSAERGHARLLGLLVLASTFAALIGLFAAYRAFRRQQQLSELKSNFVSSVSHELRAPIASVRLMSENLERGNVREPHRQNEYFRLIVQECRRLSSLIENILDFSRIEQGRKQYELEPTDLAALARQTVKLMEPCAMDRQVHSGIPFSPMELSPPKWMGRPSSKRWST